MIRSRRLGRLRARKAARLVTPRRPPLHICANPENASPSFDRWRRKVVVPSSIDRDAALITQSHDLSDLGEISQGVRIHGFAHATMLVAQRIT